MSWIQNYTCNFRLSFIPLVKCQNCHFCNVIDNFFVASNFFLQSGNHIIKCSPFLYQMINFFANRTIMDRAKEKLFLIGGNIRSSILVVFKRQKIFYLLWARVALKLIITPSSRFSKSTIRFPISFFSFMLDICPPVFCCAEIRKQSGFFNNHL